MQRPAVGSDVESDYIESLRVREKENRVYDPTAKYIRDRVILLNWVDSATTCYEYPITVRGLLTDRILSQVRVGRSRYHLVTISCFLIAAKIEARSDTIPSFDAMCRSLDGTPYSPQNLQEMEILILNKLNWIVFYASSAHFLVFFRQHPLVFFDDLTEKGALTMEDSQLFDEFLLFFDKYSLLRYDMKKYRPSQVAGSIILVTRRVLRFLRIWRPEYERVLGSAEQDFHVCSEELWHLYSSEFGSKVLQSAAATSSPSSIFFS